MALSPLMLTAYAAIAVPSLDLDGYREITRDGCVAILGRTADGALVSVTSPLTSEAAAIQDREHAMGRVLTRGVQSRLPFSVPSTLGATSADGHRIVVSAEVQGVPAASVKNVRDMWPSLGAALAAIHSLPVGIAASGSLSSQSALDTLRDAAGIIDRATHTTRVPSVLLDRWDAAVEDTEMWQFTPTVVHGNFDLDAVVTDGHAVSGITQWASAHIGDPAHDLRFAIGRLSAEHSAQILNAYTAARPSRDTRLEHRARFLSELDIAQWLLHGIDRADEAIIADAVGLLDGLVAAVVGNPAAALSFTPVTPTILAPQDDATHVSDSVEPADAPVLTDAERTAAEPAAGSIVGAGVAATASALASKLGSLSWKRGGSPTDAHAVDTPVAYERGAAVEPDDTRIQPGDTFVEPDATLVQPAMVVPAAAPPTYDTEPLFVEPEATTESPAARFIDGEPATPARNDDEIF